MARTKLHKISLEELLSKSELLEYVTHHQLVPHFVENENLKNLGLVYKTRVNKVQTIV